MIIEITHEDGLFAIPLPAYAHGVNCGGVMGAGIAAEFRRRYSSMFTEYNHRCCLGLIRPGDIMTWAAPDAWVYNLATQDRPGPDATLSAVYASAVRALVDARLRGIPRIGMPRIGCGIGGLTWEDVRSQLLAASVHAPAVELVIVTLPTGGTV